MEIDPLEESSSSSSGSAPSVRETPQEGTTGSEDEVYRQLIDILPEEKGTDPEGYFTRTVMAGLEGITHSAEETSDMTREELQAHLEANEARVEQMTDRVEQRLQAIDEKLGVRMGQIEEIDAKMEEREEKFYSQIESTLANFRAERQSDLGDLKKNIGELSGELEGIRDSNRASFRNNRILVGVAGVVLVIVQILVTVWLT